MLSQKETSGTYRREAGDEGDMSSPSRNKAGAPLMCSALNNYGSFQVREEPGILMAFNPHFKTPKLNSKAASRSGRREPSRRGAVAQSIIRVLQEIWRGETRNNSAAGWSRSQGEISEFICVFLSVPFARIRAWDTWGQTTKLILDSVIWGTQSAGKQNTKKSSYKNPPISINPLKLEKQEE